MPHGLFPHPSASLHTCRIDHHQCLLISGPIVPLFPFSFHGFLLVPVQSHWSWTRFCNKMTTSTSDQPLDLFGSESPLDLADQFSFIDVSLEDDSLLPPPSGKFHKLDISFWTEIRLMQSPLSIEVFMKLDVEKLRLLVSYRYLILL